MRLLAGSLDRINSADERSAFLHDLITTDRYVFDFLAEEVLRHQESDVRTFLLETSILSELTPTLCRAVTGRSDAAVVLEKVYRRNLFLVAVEPGASPHPPPREATLPAYRYHHLFAEFLRGRLAQEMPERVAELHRRAAEAASVPAQTINHYLAAGCWEEAAEAIEQAAQEMFLRGAVDILRRWLEALPASTRAARPTLNWMLGNCALFKGEVEVAQSIMERALRDSEAVGQTVDQGEALTNLAAGALLQADFERAGLLIHQALALPTSRVSLMELLMARTWLGMFRGDWAQAAADFDTALAMTLESRDKGMWQIMGLYLQPPLATLPGGLERLERYCSQVTAYIDSPDSPMQLALDDLMMFVHLWRGRLDEAIRAGESVLKIKEQLGGFLFLGLTATVYTAAVHAARGAYAVADRFFHSLQPQIEQTGIFEVIRAGFLFQRGRVRWAQGRVEEAREMYARMRAAESPGESPEAPVLRQIMCGLLEMAEGRLPQAEQTLRRAVSLEQNTPSAALYGSARAGARYGRGAHPAQSRGPPFDRCRRQQSGHCPPSRHQRAHCKVHVTHILVKLRASSRTQAAARARELGLVA